MVYQVAGVVAGYQGSNTPYKIYVRNQSIANEVWTECSSRWIHEYSLEMSLLCQSLGKSRIGEQKYGHRIPHRDLESRIACMTPAYLRALVKVSKKNVRQYNEPIYVP